MKTILEISEYLTETAEFLEKQGFDITILGKANMLLLEFDEKQDLMKEENIKTI